ncbi:receptor kinase 2 [Euphorbia peplus]|nr:receptor kinase 2 [Euphorbia peplus]
MDTVQSTEGHDIYVRVDAETLAEYATKRKPFLKTKGTLAILVISVVLAMFFIVLFGCVWMRKKRKTKVKMRGLFSSSMRYGTEENRQSPDLLVYSLRALSIATNNFDPANKLGQGGFGSVYKGQLDDGQEIAVKRLSRNSGQGAEEFENEVVLIAKLQHRNLVKLLGCCIQKEEQMLIYEYLPNKSLDHFIFDQRRKSVLDWRKRFDIIVGIARGMLYLHHDSRLRIVHRDLKTSNVLLDADMNPKISDFGMARIFKGDEVQDKTNRVVGTYGYMAPEYAVFGNFSTKSDVFSFGVILLEIISSKKCNSPYPEGPSLNLIGHVWELWKEGREAEMVDPSVREKSSMDSGEVSRCIQIGLLCVQEKAEDRPNMSNVVLMLNAQTSLPCPNPPAFLFTSDLNPSFSTHPRDTDDSVNELTISKFHAR